MLSETTSWINNSSISLVYVYVNKIYTAWYKFLIRANIENFLIIRPKFSYVPNVSATYSYNVAMATNFVNFICQFSQCQFVNVFPCQKFASTIRGKYWRGKILVNVCLPNF